MSNLLIVDDEQDFCELVTEYLADYFETIEVANSVPEAIGKIKANAFTFIILDMNLVSGSGLTIVKYARRTDSLNFKTPILIVSGKVSVDLSSYPLSSFLGKPFNEQQLLSKLREFRASLRQRNDDYVIPATHPELTKLLKKN